MSFKLNLSEELKKIEEYFDHIFSSVNLEANKVLYDKFLEARGRSKLSRKRSGRSIVRMRGYIIPLDVKVSSSRDIPIIPSIVSNPALGVKGDEAYIYLRIASTGSTFSRTFIVYTTLRVEELRGRIQVKGYPLLYAIMPYECVEDPRIDPDTPQLLYHVRALYQTQASSVITFQSRVNGRVDEIEAVYFYSSKWGSFLLQDYRDTFPLNRGFMAIRPYFKDRGFGVIAIGPREGAKVEFDEMEIVPELLPQHGELKSGGNASLKISRNEYLLIYHIVDNHGIYYTYAALFSDDAELLALMEEPLIVPDIGVYSGRRPSTVFVCGAAKYGNIILISAGRDDEISIIYEVEEEKLLSKLKYLRG